MSRYDVAVIGAGPAGLICARNAARRGLSVALVDRHERPGVKLSMAGGGRGNFTNRTLTEKHYLTDDPSLVRAVLRSFPCEKTLELLRALRLPFEERDFGQIFGLRPAVFLPTDWPCSATTQAWTSISGARRHHSRRPRARLPSAEAEKKRTSASSPEEKR